MKRAPRKLRWSMLAVALVIAASPLACVAYFIHCSHAHYLWEVRRGQEDLDRQLTELKSSRRNAIYLYDTRDTDLLLRQLEGLAEVEELTIELTDVSEAGMASVATLPRLRKLVLYGGRGITDRGLASVGGLTSLNELVLKNTLVTNNGLRVLQEMRSLRSLEIFCEPRLETLDDAGLMHVKHLQALERLALTGGWASFHAVEELRAQLPRCKVRTDATASELNAGL